VKVESWGGEIAEIGAIYPFGGEVILVLLGVVLWIAWFVVQGRMENREYEEEMSESSDE
jgi:ABC-type transporter Mla subunit MlaD